jgi:hypothetical protein
MAEAWSGSAAPFLLTRAAEKAGEVNDLSAAIERMAQGPQLADLWDFDRKLALAVVFRIYTAASPPAAPVRLLRSDFARLLILDLKGASLTRRQRKISLSS